MRKLIEIFLPVIVIYLICHLSFWIWSIQCKTKAEIQNLEYNYGIIQGCMIKMNDKWIDYNRLRVLE